MKPSVGDINLSMNVEKSKTMNFVKVFENITKSETDLRSYRALLLANELKVMLVSYPETDKSAACLSVRTGSFTDPTDMPGLAHFCEHMILLGSDKYPEENSYSQFLTLHNGFCNAYTSAEETSFVFDIEPEHLADALMIFSALFASPRFTESAIEREVNAVDSEHEKNMTNDLRKLIQLDKTLSDPNHDYHKFSTGNRSTLYDLPKTRSISLREKLIEFHKINYSSNKMTLTIMGKESLDEMEEKFAPMFANIPNLDIPVKCWSTSPWSENFLKKKVFMIPIKNVNELHIFWPINDYSKHYKARPTGYLTHLLGHESAGSLLSALKKRGLANGLSSEMYRPATGFACFLLRIELTESGVDEIDNIITMVFQYIEMIRVEGIQEWIFKEECDLRALQFRFKGHENPYQYVMSLSSRQFLYPAEDVLSAIHIISEFRPNLISEILDCLRPDSFRYFVMSQKNAKYCNQTEFYYGTKYFCESIPLELIKKWQNCGICEDLNLPHPNLYMPYDFDLKPIDDPNSTNLPPQLIFNESGSKLWFKQDAEYKLPKVFVSYNLISPFWCQDPVMDLIYQLFISLFNDSVNEEVYFSTLSGLYFNITAAPSTIRLTFHGYNHRMALFVDKIVYNMLTYLKPDGDRFNCLLTDMKQRVNNFSAMPPYEQADGHCASLIYDRFWSYEERREALKEITYVEVVRFIQSVFNRIFVETLVYGNCTSKEAENYHNVMLKALKECSDRHPPVTDIQSLMREVELPNGLPQVYKQKNQDNPSSAILIYFQCSPNSVESSVMHRLCVQMISEPAFNILRTEKQLGYIVHTGWHQSNSMQGIRIVIQSKFHPRELDEHIENFIAGLEAKLVEMSPSEFKVHKDSVMSCLLEKPKTIKQQNLRYWGQIIRQRYEFNRYELEAVYLKTVTKDQMIQFYRKHIKSDSPLRRKLAIYMISDAAEPPDPSLSDTATSIISPSQFKRSRPFCSLSKSSLPSGSNKQETLENAYFIQQ